MRIFDSYRIAEFVERLSVALRWDKLGAIGRSNIGRLTILIPFVGYLIIFNPSFISFFRQELPGGIPNTYEWFSELHELRLIFLYFGLLFLGVGNLLFILLAPEALRRHSDVSGYVAEMEDVASPSLIANKLDETIFRFQQVNEGEAASPLFSGQSPSFPSDASQYLHDLISSLWRDIPEEGLPDVAEQEEPLGSLYEGSPYTVYSGSGYLLTDNVMNMMTTGGRASLAFQFSMHQAAVGRSKEVFFVEFFSLGYARFVVRTVIGFFFLIGFLALIVPTLTTSILVLLTAFQAPVV